MYKKNKLFKFSINSILIIITLVVSIYYGKELLEINLQKHKYSLDSITINSLHETIKKVDESLQQIKAQDNSQENPQVIHVFKENINELNNHLSDDQIITIKNMFQAEEAQIFDTIGLTLSILSGLLVFITILITLTTTRQQNKIDETIEKAREDMDKLDNASSKIKSLNEKYTSMEESARKSFLQNDTYYHLLMLDNRLNELYHAKEPDKLDSLLITNVKDHAKIKFMYDALNKLDKKNYKEKILILKEIYRTNIYSKYALEYCIANIVELLVQSIEEYDYENELNIVHQFNNIEFCFKEFIDMESHQIFNNKEEQNDEYKKYKDILYSIIKSIDSIEKKYTQFKEDIDWLIKNIPFINKITSEDIVSLKKLYGNKKFSRKLTKSMKNQDINNILIEAGYYNETYDWFVENIFFFNKCDYDLTRADGESILSYEVNKEVPDYYNLNNKKEIGNKKTREKVLKKHINELYGENEFKNGSSLVVDAIKTDKNHIEIITKKGDYYTNLLYNNLLDMDLYSINGEFLNLREKKEISHYDIKNRLESLLKGGKNEVELPEYLKYTRLGIHIIITEEVNGETIVYLHLPKENSAIGYKSDNCIYNTHVSAYGAINHNKDKSINLNREILRILNIKTNSNVEQAIEYNTKSIKLQNEALTILKDNNIDGAIQKTKDSIKQQEEVLRILKDINIDDAIQNSKDSIKRQKKVLINFKKDIDINDVIQDIKECIHLRENILKILESRKIIYNLNNIKPIDCHYDTLRLEMTLVYHYEFDNNGKNQMNFTNHIKVPMDYMTCKQIFSHDYSNNNRKFFMLSNQARASLMCVLEKHKKNDGE